MMKRLLLAVAVAMMWTAGARAQMLAANVDALWLATLTPNIGVELVVGEHRRHCWYLRHHLV